jgi:hypothetical protein
MGKKSESSASPTQLSALPMLPAFFCIIPISSLYMSVPKNQRGPGTVCTGIPYSRFQRPSQCNTLLLSTKKILQLPMYTPKLCSLTVVNQPWNIKEYNWYCPIWTKAKYGCDTVVMCPPIVLTFLNVSIPQLLQIKLEAIHCFQAVCKK